MEDYLATALAAASKGKTQRGETPEEDTKEVHDESGELGEGHHMAAKEMMECADSGDHEGYARALHSFVRMSK
jgi:hypothetical protein